MNLKKALFLSKSGKVSLVEGPYCISVSLAQEERPFMRQEEGPFYRDVLILEVSHCGSDPHVHEKFYDIDSIDSIETFLHDKGISTEGWDTGDKGVNE